MDNNPSQNLRSHWPDYIPTYRTIFKIRITLMHPKKYGYVDEFDEERAENN